MTVLTEEQAELCRGWSPRGLATFYEAIFAEQGWKLLPFLLPVCLGFCDTRINKLMLIIGPGVGKALHPDTLVATPTGRRPIKDLKVGDLVLTPDGWAVPIRAVMPQCASRLYRLTFDDGRQVIANKDHLWKAYTKKFASLGISLPWRLRTTSEIATYLRHNRANRWYVPLTDPVPYPPADLPIDPYVMGALLGDGHIGDNGFPSLTSFDPHIVNRVREHYTVSQYTAEGHFGVLGIAKSIKELKLDGSRSWDKFIPESYKMASIEQRYNLIQGLMDTDGYVTGTGSLVYTTVSKQLADDVREVIWSLGGIAGVSEKETGYNVRGLRKECRTAYNVYIRHSEPAKLISLPRKRERAHKTQYSDNLKLEIVDIEPIQEEESICININDPAGLFLCGDYVVTHNSQLLSVTIPAWIIGHNPNSATLGISGGEALMQGFQDAVMDIVEKSTAWKQIFPNVRPDKQRGWSTTGGMFVTGRKPGLPDANYLAAGIDSKYLTGKHGSLIIVDDIHNEENSATAEQCEKVVQKYAKTVIGRADPMGARFVMAGRRWHTDDIYGKLKDSDWVVLELPHERPGKHNLYYDVYVPDGMECVFTDKKCLYPTGELVPWNATAH